MARRGLARDGGGHRGGHVICAAMMDRAGMDVKRNLARRQGHRRRRACPVAPRAVKLRGRNDAAAANAAPRTPKERRS